MGRKRKNQPQLNNDIQDVKEVAKAKKPVDDIERMEVIAAPNSGRERDNGAVESNSSYDLPDHKLSVAEFRGTIVTMPHEEVVPYFLSLLSEEMIENPRATVLELRRLGYNTEIEGANIVLKEENKDE
jgi:hypothetical protein